MPPPLTPAQEAGLYDLYYNKHYTFGRDKLWRIANAHDLAVSQTQVMAWLKKQETWQLFQRRKPPRIVRSTITRAPRRVMGVDLADVMLISWDGVQYLLTAIDLFSKKAWVRPLPNKKAETVARAMDDILTESGGTAGVRSDQGAEFVNPAFRAVLAKHGVKQILSLPGKPQSNGQVERLNGILKAMIKQTMRASDDRDWPSYLPELVSAYNNSYQTTIKMTPNEAHDVAPEAMGAITERIKIKASALATPPLFRVGDTVRVVKSKVSNDGEIWSKTLHRVVRVLRARSAFVAPVYRLDGAPWRNKREPRPDWMGNKYEEDLQLVEAVENTRDSAPKWDISKLLRKQSRDGQDGWMVRWKTGEITWEPTANLKRDVPKLLRSAQR